MKKLLFNILVASAAIGGAMPEAVASVPVSGVQMEQAGDYLNVRMTLGLDGLNVSSNRAVLLTPCLVNGSDSLTLPAVGVYGRTRYYQYQRSGSMISGSGEESFKASDCPASVDYSRMVPYAQWMDGAQLVLRQDEYGCCRKLLASHSSEEGRFTGRWFPELVYVVPAARPDKTFSVEGSAFIDFPVNRTDIDPDYRSNAAELGKIKATVDEVSGDGDVTVTGLSLKGYASPDGPYDNNARLAAGRTEALRDYVNRLYAFPAGLITTSSEPEDWDGLRRYVEKSNLTHRAEILEVINGPLAPDAKDARIKASWPDEYAFLLSECYPALRHTDYRVAYSVRRYTDVNEIRRVMATRPQNLDLDEFYLLAAEYEPGSPEFTEVYETAVRMYPADPAANLNAANAAMRRGDLEAAARYLDKAGTTPEATYARAALAIRRKDYAAARTLLQQAAAAGVSQAEETLRQLPK